MQVIGTDLSTSRLSISGYATEFERKGMKVVEGFDGTLWVKSEGRSLARIPTFAMFKPTAKEIRSLFAAGFVPVVSYIRAPDSTHPANCTLYVCEDKQYDLKNLSPPARRDARRALRELRIEPLDWFVLLKSGVQAYVETRGRLGLSDGTPESFQKRVWGFSQNRAHHAIGAWRDNQLIAFMSLIVVDTWVEIEGSFSTNTDRNLCPNDGLLHYVLDSYLVKGGYSTVSYGLSSIQKDSNELGLHRFKVKVGFEARPVYRAFEVHPLFRPFANRTSLALVKTLLRFKPHDRRLRKAGGFLEMFVNGKTRSSGESEPLPRESPMRL